MIRSAIVASPPETPLTDEVRTGAYRNLFHPDQLISGGEDASNNFARGHFTVGKTMIDFLMSTVRRAVECCEYLQNFFVLNSFGGGTGSGFASLLLDNLAIEYTNRFRVQLCVCISPVLSTSIVEPYNAALTMHASMEHTDIAILTDNEAIYGICNEKLDISRPTYANLNRLIAQNFSDMTVSVRFESSLSADMDQLVTNLIPFPRIHFPVMSHSPHVSEARAERQQLGTAEITRDVFERSCILVTCDPQAGKYMSCCLQYRGDVTPKDVNAVVYDIKRRSAIRFVEWCPTGFKLGISAQPPVSVPASEMARTPRSVSMLSNTSAINQAWLTVCHKFDLLFSKRAFVHWFVGEGMEEGELNEAKDDIHVLTSDYDEIVADVFGTADCAVEEHPTRTAHGTAQEVSFSPYESGQVSRKSSKVFIKESSTSRGAAPDISAQKMSITPAGHSEFESYDEDDDETKSKTATNKSETGKSETAKSSTST